MASGSREVTWMVMIRFLVTTLMLMAVLFLAAGKTDWWEGWAVVIQHGSSAGIGILGIGPVNRKMDRRPGDREASGSNWVSGGNVI